MPRTGKHSVALGLVAGTPRYAARHRLPVLLPLFVTCPSKTFLLPFSVAITVFTATIAVVVTAIVIFGGVIIINSGCGHAAE